MLSTRRKQSEQPDSRPLTADLIDFLISQTADKRIGITRVHTDHQKNGTINELAASCLTEQEIRQFNTYTFEKRRREWLLGRICAKQAVLEMVDSTATPCQMTALDIAIDAAPSGRPFVTFQSGAGNQPIPDISISHSGQKIIALAANGYCGIDIQILTDTLFKVKDRFCSEQENNLLHAIIDDELPQLGLLWVAKEAVRKCFGSFKTIGFQSMQLTHIDLRKSCSFLEMQLDCRCAGVDVVTVATTVEDEYCLGACLVTKKADHA